MQRGCLKPQTRKRGSNVWQFRWSEVRPDGKRLHHKKIVGTVEQYPDENAARQAVVGLVSEITASSRPLNSCAMTVAQLCDHFAQRELAKDNSWRSHATKKIYQAYLTRWIRPHWQKYELADVRTIQVESWLRGLPLARSSCAKIRNLMSVLFNHACRYEFFDRNPIHLVRQSAKRRTAPAILMPAEIKALINGLALREHTLVLLAASTGLRQSEIFGLKWGDIDFAQGAMSVTRSIVYGVVGPCKTESSQKPVPIHPILADSLVQWRERSTYIKPDDWVFASKRYRGRRPYWGQAILRKYIRPVAQRLGIQKRFGWHTFRPHVLDPAAKCGDGAQGHAGVVAAFVLPVNVGRLHAGSHAGEARRTGRCRVAGIFLRYEPRTIRCRRRKRCQIMMIKALRKRAKRTRRGRQTCPFGVLDGFNKGSLTLLE